MRLDKSLQYRTRIAALMMLVLLVGVLCVDLEALLNFEELTPPQNSADSAKVPAISAALARWRLLDKHERQFLSDEYQTVVSEIRQRLQDEHLLFGLKFALVGAILYVAFQNIGSRSSVRLERTSLIALITWAAVVTAAIVDVRIVANQRMIRALGKWVGMYEEIRLGHAGIDLGWEAFLASERVHAGLRLSG